METMGPTQARNCVPHGILCNTIGLQSTNADQTLSLSQSRFGRIRGISKYKDSKLDLTGNLVIYEINLLKN